MLKKLLVHTSTYTIGNLLVTIAGFISFPLYTRVLTVADYGIMNTISAILLLLAAVAKLGVQHATIRYYAEVKAGKNALDLNAFYATVFWGMAITGLVLMLIWILIVVVLPLPWWQDPKISGLLLMTSVLILVRNINSAMTNILRAQQRSTVLSIFNVVNRYATLALTIGILFYAITNVTGFYISIIIAEILAVTAMFLYLRRDCQFAPSQTSWPLYRMMLVYGIPMIGFEMSSILLNLGGRLTLLPLQGEEAVGLYSAAYSLCEYVQLTVIAAINQAISPIYLRLWEEKGEAATRQFVEQSLHYYLLIAPAIFAGLVGVGDELIVLLASDKYAAATPMIPFVIAGMLLDGAVMVFGAGLYIRKQTKILMYLVFACALLNLVLCAGLIPVFGMKGAAIAMLLSYSVLALAAWFVSVRRLPVTLPWLSLLKFSAIAALMYYVVSLVHVDSLILTLMAKVSVGAACYGVLVLLVDERTRDAVIALLKRLRARQSAA